MHEEQVVPVEPVTPVTPVQLPANEPLHEVPVSRHRERTYELVATVLLALATVGTAWSGYQATRWSGVQAQDYVTASGLRVESTKAATVAGQDRLYDSQVFSQWLNPYHAGDVELAGLYERRFRAEFRPAFDAWLATQPFTNPDAPPGPLFMPEYVSAVGQRSVALEQQATAMFETGQAANETGDSYVLITVFLASGLFLAGISGRFVWQASRIAVLLLAAVAVGFGFLSIVQLPVG